MTKPSYQRDAEQFESWATAIYDIYPRKVAKRAAVKAIIQALRRKRDELAAAGKPDADLQAIKLISELTLAYRVAVDKWGEDDRKYIPYPSTWYNQGRYDDDPREWTRTERVGPGLHTGPTDPERRAKTY